MKAWRLEWVKEKVLLQARKKIINDLLEVTH